MSGVIVPGRRDVGLLSTVMKGLSIARDVYGIKSDMAQIEQMGEAEKRRVEQEAETKKEKERVARGEMKTGEYQKLLLEGKNKEVAQGTEGAIRVPVVDQGGTVFDKYVVKAEPSTALKAPTSRRLPNGDLEEWDPKSGWKVVAKAPPKEPKSPRDEAFDKLPKDQQNVVNGLSTDVGKKIAATSLLDEQLAQFKAAHEAGDEAKAAIIGGNMVKLLNSDQGADAVGAEESKRLATDLEYQIANFFGKGETWGRNLPRFFETAAGKSNAMKASARANQQLIEQIYAGGGLKIPSDIESKLPEGGGAGKALANTPEPGFVFVSNGKETVQIPESDVAAAAKDGYSVVGGGK